MSNPKSSIFQGSYITAGGAAKMAGVLLLATAALTAVMVYARVTADADQGTMLLSLQAIGENSLMFGLSGGMRLLSGLTFLAAGLLLRTWIIRQGLATQVVPYLFVLSGAFTVASGTCAVLIVLNPALEAVSAAGSSFTSDYTTIGSLYNLRWITGKIGFAAAGIALIIAARYQWRVGGTLRKVAPGSAILGVAMQFIWLDAATIMHPIVGTAFFLWLLVIGTMLATGRVERHFIAAYGRDG
jgi:hypothetical protein